MTFGNWIKGAICAGLLGVVALPGQVAAQTVAEFIFDEALLSRLGPGSTLNYTHTLTSPEGAPRRAFEGGAIDVTYDETESGSGEVVMRLANSNRTVDMKPLPTVGGNPLVMVFLENTTRAMAGIAGGSPFYIRNRIKNALMTGGEENLVPVDLDGTTQDMRKVTLLPFALDPNKQRMGQFAFLELSFVYDDAVPGGIQELRAFVPSAQSDGAQYEELITFSKLEASQ